MATLDLGYKVDSYFHSQHQSPISTSFLGVETPPSYCFSHFHKNILTILLKSVFIILWNAIKTAYLIYFVFLRLMHFFLLLMTSLSILLGWPLLPTLCPPCTLGKLIDGVRTPCSLVLRSSVYWFSFFNLNEVLPSREYQLQFN